jgi:hypothetical protein
LIQLLLLFKLLLLLQSNLTGKKLKPPFWAVFF